MRIRVASNGIGRESIKSAAKRAIPSPLIELAVGVEVSIAVFAPREKVAVGSVSWSDAVLVFSCEWCYCQSPRESRCLLSIRIDRETRHRCSDGHVFRSSFFFVSEVSFLLSKVSENWVRRMSTVMCANWSSAHVSYDVNLFTKRT